MHDPDHPGHVDLPDGRALDLRPMYISDKRVLVDLDARVSGGETILQIDYDEQLAGVLERGVTWRSWDGSLTDMTRIRLLNLIAEWAVITEDDALPPVSGTSSEMPSPEPSSAAEEPSPFPSTTPSSE